MPTPTNRRTLALLVAFLTATPVFAGLQNPRSIQERARGSQRVVVATVASLEARWETNDFGDRLIVSKAVLTVDETMKGASAELVEMDIEGGTVGEITLKVSDLPALSRGQRAVFFLARGRNGRMVPHMRGQSILALDAQQRVAGTDVSLGEVRSEVAAAAQ